MANDDLLPVVTRWACEHCAETFESAARVTDHKRRVHSSVTVQEKVVRDKTHPVCPDSFVGQKMNNFFQGFDQAWEDLFGMARQLVRTTFRNRVENVLKREFPALRRSAARTIMEGRLRIGCPSISIPVTHERRIQRILSLLDIFETLVHIEHAGKKEDDEKPAPAPTPVAIEQPTPTRKQYEGKKRGRKPKTLVTGV